jgi:UDP-N-acetylmuramate--alanine ligase
MSMHCSYKHVHLIGVGGIHVSAIAKLLLSLGVGVSGSDLVENEQTEELRTRGVKIAIEQSADNIPSETQAIVFSSAANETNLERIEGARRGLPAFNSHQFLGVLGANMKQIVITGTHGKSTTTAMMGVMLKAAGVSPTVVVGTRVPQFTDGNLEVGTSEWLVVEGDEFDHHFLAYQPTVLVINNIEADHFDIYPTIEAMLDAYRSLLSRVVNGGKIIANMDDANVRRLLDGARASLSARNIQITSVGTKIDSSLLIGSREILSGQQVVHLSSTDPRENIDVKLAIPGAMNAMNAVMCYATSEVLDLPREKSLAGLADFRGIWRRLEKIGEKNGVIIFSDYGHHPTAVTKTLEAVKEFYPDRRIVLCFQPHHRNRTKHLFTQFTTCFDLANILVLSEIYDVKGRDQAEDETMSSKDLAQAVEEHAASIGMTQSISYVSTPHGALSALQSLLKPNDILIVMGAGDIYKIAYALI